MRKSDVQHTEAIRIPSRGGATKRSPHAWWTTAALVIAVAVVVARMTMLETLREAMNALPGQTPIRGAGAPSGLVLDLIACVPAMLVLARRWLDRSFALRFQWSPLIFTAMAVWAAVTTLWAGDRFASVVGAMHLLGAAALMWAVVQIVTDWKKLRLLAGLCFGLLLVFAAQGLMFHFFDRPDMIRAWDAQKFDYYKAQGWEPDSFVAQQFDRRVRATELFGFFASPNTFAAMIVLAMLVAIGVVIQRFSDRDEPVWPVLVLLAMPLGVWLIWQTQSKAGKASLLLGGVMLAAVHLLRGRFVLHAAKFYWAGVAAVFAGALAVVGHGAYHGNLMNDSLNFRWNYWVGSFKLFLTQPLHGVGWNNFGQRYLAHRLPVASEEIKDPHNFIVRVMTELGAVGLLILVAWLMRVWWEMTRPRVPLAAEGTSTGREKRFAGIGLVAAAAGLGMLMDAVCSIDWRQDGAYVILELFKRFVFFAVLFGGVVVVAIRSTGDERLDDRSARWVLVATVIAMACFMLHSLIDFAMFETGPMFLTALLIGAVLGMRSVAREKRVPRRWALYALAGLTVVWLAVAGVLVAPVVEAEGLADQAVDELAVGNATASMDRFEAAAKTLPINYAYPAGAARAADALRLPYTAVRAFLDRAIEIDPFAGELYAQRAGLELRQPRPDPNRVTIDFGHALRLNPNDVGMRLEYAAAIERLGNPAEALRQYRAAIEKDDQLSPDEPKRLPPARVAEIRAIIDRLEKAR